MRAFRLPFPAELCWPLEMRFRLFAVAALVLGTSFAVGASLTPEEQKIVAAVTQRIGDFPRDLEEAVQISSATEDLPGVRRVGKLFQDQLSALGLDSKFVDLPENL